MKRPLTFLTGVLSALALQSAFALPLSGESSGQWVNATPTGGTVVVNGLGTSTFKWGDATGFGTGQNSLSFTAATFTGETETPFKIGSISYFNGTIAIGSVPDSVELGLTVNFGVPAGSSITSNYRFDLLSTPNTGSDTANADYVYLPQVFGSTSFVIGDTTYNVKLTGFENVVGDGFLGSDHLQFHVLEGKTASADLFAVVTAQTAPVPEPSSYAMLLAGLGAIGMVVRRRRRSS